MGRRALPKLNPNLEYSDYYGEIESLSDGWDVTSIFDSSKPLEVELGSGKGLFLTTASGCLLYTSPSPRDAHESRMPSSA